MKNPTSIPLIVGLVILAGIILQACTAESKEKEKPNFVFVLVDDLSWSDLSCNGSVFYEIKPDRMPIAIYLKMDKFNTQEVQLEKGDCIYMFSDGFADQFGGPNARKFKYKPFKQLLFENADKPMAEQKSMLEKAFNDWKGDTEKVDDVVVLGLRI